MDFNDVIGQQDAKNRLSQMIEEQRIPHALMLCGPKLFWDKDMRIVPTQKPCSKHGSTQTYISHIL